MKQFIDRSYNRIFNKSKCYKIEFSHGFFRYNDIVWNGTGYSRCLGKSWFKLI